MISSNRFGGGVTSAWPRVQIRPAPGTEPGAVLTAESEVGLGAGQGQLFAHHIGNIHRPRPLRQWVRLGIVRGIGIAAKDGRWYVYIELGDNLGQASAAGGAEHPLQTAPPEILAIAGSLQLTLDPDRPHQIQPQILERRMVRLQLSIRPDRTP